MSVSLILLTVRSQWNPDRTYYWYNDLRIITRIVLLRRKNTWLTTRPTFTTSKEISAKNAIMTKTHNDIKTHIVTYEKEIQRKRNGNTKLPWRDRVDFDDFPERPRNVCQGSYWPRHETTNLKEIVDILHLVIWILLDNTDLLPVRVNMSL